MSGMRLTVLFVLVACVVRADDPPRATERPKESLAGLAGTYYMGDGLGFKFSIIVKPEGRFSYTHRGCLGLYARVFGTARVADGHLTFTPDLGSDRVAAERIAGDFIPVRWQGRLYLLSEAERKAFCSAVNTGDEPRQSAIGHQYLRGDDWKKTVTGTPLVPEAWKPLLLKKPLRGKVIEVREPDRLVIDLGSDDGVYEGMNLKKSG